LQKQDAFEGDEYKILSGGIIIDYSLGEL